MNINWEYLHFSKWKLFFRFYLAVMIAVLVIVCGALLIKFLDNKAYHYYNEYSIVNCPIIITTYTSE